MKIITAPILGAVVAVIVLCMVFLLLLFWIFVRLMNDVWESNVVSLKELKQQSQNQQQ